MDLKFTSLQERNVYNSSQIKDWCRDGDLMTYVTGEFDIITIMGNKHFSYILSSQYDKLSRG